jgi:hypothetical protein
VENRASTVLELQRLRLPAPNLSIYATESGSLWTEAVGLVRDADGDFAAVRISETPPDEAGSTHFVAPARQAPVKDTLLRSFGHMLRRGGLHG